MVKPCCRNESEHLIDIRPHRSLQSPPLSYTATNEAGRRFFWTFQLFTLPHKNTSSVPITATPKFTLSAGLAAGNSIALPAINLLPRQAVKVDLSPLNTAQRVSDLDTVSVEVSNTGAPGSLIGALYSLQ
jgi:hypothetical protein